jgi:apolipoprotein N-acyltransferase
MDDEHELLVQGTYLASGSQDDALTTINPTRENSMTLIIYLVGWIIFIGGVSWALVAMHVSQHTIAITAVIMLGIAVITGATRARSRDRSQ